MNNDNNKPQFFSTREETIKWLNKYKIQNYTINDDLSVDVNGEVNISHRKLKVIPIKFAKVTGSFWCQDNQLTSLVGSPKSVGGNFNCGNNHLISIKESPKTVGSNFWCNNNPLISLLELDDCSFENIVFSIDIKNFQQKELIQILKKYYISKYERYELTNRQFQDIIKPQIEKEILQDKINKLYVYIKTKKIFI